MPTEENKNQQQNQQQKASFSEALATLVAPYAPALRLDAFLPAYTRKTIKNIVSIVAAAATVYLIYDKGPEARAIFLLVFLVWAKLSLFEFFYNSYSYKPKATVSFALAAVLGSLATDVRFKNFSNRHWGSAFFVSRYGQWVAARAGISDETRLALIAALDADTDFATESEGFPQAFLAHIAPKLKNSDTEITQFGIDALISTLVAKDKHFVQACANASIDPSDIVGAARWLEWGDAAEVRRERWWLERNLAHIPGIGKRWSFGDGVFLTQWGRDLSEAARWGFAPGSGYSYNFGYSKPDAAAKTGGPSPSLAARPLGVRFRRPGLLFRIFGVGRPYGYGYGYGAGAYGAGGVGGVSAIGQESAGASTIPSGVKSPAAHISSATSLHLSLGDRIRIRLRKIFAHSWGGASRGRTAWYQKQFLVDEKVVEQVEDVLARFSGANALIVGDIEHGASDILPSLALRIADTHTHPQLQHLRLIVLDIGFIISDRRTKADFEDVMQRLLNEATLAGNVILVFDDLPYAIESAATIGVNLPVLLSRMLMSDMVRVIALASPRKFNDIIEQQSELSKHFEKITYREPKGETLLRQLCIEAERLENRLALAYMYGAIAAAARAAERYFVEMTAYDKARDLLLEAGAAAISERRHIVRASDVLRLVEQKTDIPVAGIENMNAAEKDKLLKLEEFLAKRVVGQRPALKAVADSMRRAHSGINNPDRPMGSFLFLGPTGVGKTETAKALAASFFGGEDNIIRFDMTEYQGEQALYRLIGERAAIGGGGVAGAIGGGGAAGGSAAPISLSSAVTRTGTLVSALRDRKYGVLLLDEFEKTSQQVKDLFLQILDEGVFTDINGEKVTARNTIIIATSNAGSDMIWKAVGEGRDVVAEKETIIDGIVQTGSFRPELINRFDGAIIFSPLSESELQQVGRLMLAKLNKRLVAKSVSVKITDELVAYLAGKGSDRRYGGRAMNRAIQEVVEARVAEKLIAGEYTAGQEIEIDPQSLGDAKDVANATKDGAKDAAASA